jgi:O-antigen ligase
VQVNDGGLIRMGSMFKLKLKGILAVVVLWSLITLVITRPEWVLLLAAIAAFLFVTFLVYAIAVDGDW